MNRVSDGDAAKGVRGALTLSLTRRGDMLLFSQMAFEFYRKPVTTLIVSDKQRMLSLLSALGSTLRDSGRRQSSILTSHPLGWILWTEVLGLKSRVLTPAGSVLSGSDISDARRCLGTSQVNETSVPA